MRSKVSKTRRTLYRDDKVENARNNIERYAWAMREKERAVAEAAPYASLGYDALWRLVLPQSLPRSICVHADLGSPVTGKECLVKYGPYGWKLNPEGMAWKVLDPSSDTIFPTNDFEAFYNSGLDEHGIFNRALADESLLVNTLYPERGPTWGVDDGLGWIDPDGEKWTFIAYYAHWHYRRTLETAVAALRDAYVYTDNLQYARAGIIILDRIADLYPTYDLAVWKWEDGYRNSHGMTGEGKFIGSIWETVSVKVWISAYDAFFPAMGDPEIVQFLSEQAKQHQLDNPKSSVDAIRENIECGIVRSILPDVESCKIRGNHGMHESGLAMAAVVLDDPGTEANPGITREILDFLFRPGAYDRKRMRITGCNVLGTLIDAVDRDGMGDEGSPSYNTIWPNGFMEIAEILDGYDGYEGADLYQNVKMKKMLTVQHPLVMLGRYTPQIGDTGATGSLGTILNLDHYVKAFEKYGEPITAQVAHFIHKQTADESASDESASDGSAAAGMRGDIFAADPHGTAHAIERLVEEHGPWKQCSLNLTGYGFAALRDGERSEGNGSPRVSTEAPVSTDTRRGLWIKYGRNNRGHGHADDLNIDVYAYGLSLVPDLGYPEQATPNPRRINWTSNTISHNTVVVNRSRQKRSWVGLPHHFDGEGPVQLIDVESPAAYPEIERYRRTVAMIRIDDERSYVVDFFRVNGGREHHYSFHGSKGAAHVEGLNLVPQGSGTLAGPDVPFQQQVDESGFEWLREVRRDASPPAVFSVDWAIEDFRDAATVEDHVHLRLTMATPLDSVVLAEGEPPRKAGNPSSLTYLIAERTGENLLSLFSAVLEAYTHNPCVQSVTPLPLVVEGCGDDESQVKVRSDSAQAMQVVLETGRIDTIVTSLNPERTYRVDGRFHFRGFFGVYTRFKGDEKPVFRYLHDGECLGTSDDPGPSLPGRVKGCVLDFTRDLSLENEITVRVDDGADLVGLDLIGAHIYVENDGVRNAVYEIKGVTPKGEDTYTIGIGDATPVRCYQDSSDRSKGYVYDVARKARFRIPLTWVDLGDAPAPS